MVEPCGRSCGGKPATCWRPPSRTCPPASRSPSSPSPSPSRSVVACGPDVGPAAGAWSAILAGFVAALLGGSAYAIAGPTGVLAVFMGVGVVGAHGGFSGPDALLLGFLAVALSGVFQVVFGALRLARVIEWIPYPVITGFMNGIALIILWTGATMAPSPTGDDLPDAVAIGALRAAATLAAPPVVYAAAGLAGAAFLLTLRYPELARRFPDRGAPAILTRAPGSLLARLLLTLAGAVVAGLSVVPHVRALPAGQPAFSLDLLARLDPRNVTPLGRHAGPGNPRQAPMTDLRS